MQPLIEVLPSRLHLFPAASRRVYLSVVVMLVTLSYGSSLKAQMIRTEMPMTRIHSSFYERLGIDFGFSIRGSSRNSIGDQTRGVFGLGPGGQLQPNLTFSQGGINSAIPPFGDYDPSADALFGYRIQNSSGGYHLGFRFGRGSNRSIVNTTPVLMTQNGYPGSFFSGSTYPFVTGIVPIVGRSAIPPTGVGGSVTTHPLEMKLRQLHLDRVRAPGHAVPSDSIQDSGRFTESPPSSSGSRFSHSHHSSANRGDLSVREIKRQREQQLKASQSENEKKLRTLINKAESAFAKNQIGAARSYLRTAVHLASGKQKLRLQKQLDQWQVK